MRKVGIGLLALIIMIGGYYLLNDQSVEVEKTEYETIVVEAEPVVEEVIEEEPETEVHVEFSEDIDNVESTEFVVVDSEEAVITVTELDPDDPNIVEVQEVTTPPVKEESDDSETVVVSEEKPEVESQPEPPVVEEKVDVQEPVDEVVVEEPVIEEPIVEEVVEVVDEETPANDSPLSVPEDGSIGGKSITEIAEQTSEEKKALAIGMIIGKLSSDEINRFKGYLDGGISDSERADIMNVFHTKFTADEQEWVWSVYNEVVLGK